MLAVVKFFHITTIFLKEKNMSSTTMTSSNALTLKLWATEDWVNPGQAVCFGHMMTRGAIYFVEDFLGQRARGDQITYDYTNKLTGIPVGEGGTLDGNEEALDLGNYSMAMNVTRIGVLNPNDDTIEQQRTLVSFPSRTRKLIPQRHMELLDASCFNQLAGFNPTSYTQNGTTWTGANKLFVQGHNTPVAPSTNRIVRAGGVANDQSLGAGNTMSLDLIDYALEKDANSDQPLKAFDDGTYDLYCSPEQIVDLKHDTTGAIQWFNIQLAKISGGKKNELEKSMFDEMIALGSYGNVNIYQAPRVAFGQRSDNNAVITTVRRAVLVGKDALSFASPFGGRPNDKDVPLKYFTQLKDYEYFKGIEGRMIYGLKKTVASNSEDIGVMVLSTYAAPHA
jgi:hypothetical protein